MTASGNLQPLGKNQFEQVMDFILKSGFTYEYEYKKHRLELWSDEDSLGRIYLPIDLSYDPKIRLAQIEDFYFALVIIKAGQAVSGCFHNGVLIDHKVFRAYMVRKKQGKSQIKHLKTKGKSRAGSRVRLEGMELFLEEINERLQSYENNFAIDRWGISCAKTLWPYLFASDTKPPFTKNQEDLYLLPFHIAKPSFEILTKVYNQLTSFQITLTDLGQRLLKDPLNTETKGIHEDDETETEDW